jgi:hypothetical protein
LKAVSTGHRNERPIAGALMRFTLLVAMLSLAACEKSPTAPANTYLVTAFATPALLKAGATTTVIVGITNVSSVSQTYDQNFCGPAFLVYSPAGAQVYPSGFCSAIYIPRTLAPGEQAVYAQEWTTTGADSTGHSTGPLPGGVYTLRGALGGSDVNNVAFTVQLTP